MNLRNRLTFYSTITFGIVFLAASLIILFAFYNRSLNIVFNELKNTSLLSAIYYLEQDELPQSEHSAIKEQFRSTIQSSFVAVYNSSNKVEYGELEDLKITPKILDLVRQTGHFQFKNDKYAYYGIYYPDNQGNFVVFVKTSNEEFINQIKSLIFILITVYIIGLISIFFLSRYISNVAYKPIKDIVKQVNKINYNNLEHGIEVPDTNDELEELIKTYNELFFRLSESFLIQKNFINYASHEFKTPLAAIAGSLEVFAQKERNPKEYKEVTQQALKNVYKIENILSNLLLLSGLKHSAEQQTENIRIDELIWDIHDALLEKAEEYKTQLNIQIDVDDFNILIYKANQTLIHLALYNIIENAVKYSEQKSIDIKLKNKHNKIEITIKDYGKGIESEDLKHIKTMFYRGKNVGPISGSGIGLSLAILIFEQNGIEYNIQSKVNEGTKITLLF
jgi:signal transduction histidine kinase